MQRNPLVHFALLVVLGAFPSRGIECVAHRGFSSAFQENTINSMVAAWDAGADIVELDVRVLTDNAVVLFHDETIEGRNIGSLSYAELQARTPMYHVPTLKDALEAGGEERILLLDLKDASPRSVSCVLEAVRAPGHPLPRLMFQSTKISVLKKLRNELAQPTLLYVTSLKRKGVHQRAPDPAQLANLLVRHKIDGVSAKGRQFVTREFVSSFQDRGLVYYVWTINPAERIQHYRELGVDGIITDCSDVMVRGTPVGALAN